MPPAPKPSHKRRIPKQSERNNFNEKTRKQVDARSKGICEYCHCRVATERHHVMPKARGGRGLYTNAIHLCDTCHDHNNNDLLDTYIEIYTQKYGINFYKDEWDFKY